MAKEKPVDTKISKGVKLFLKISLSFGFLKCSTPLGIVRYLLVALEIDFGPRIREAKIFFILTDGPKFDKDF